MPIMSYQYFVVLEKKSPCCKDILFEVIFVGHAFATGFMVCSLKQFAVCWVFDVMDDALLIPEALLLQGKYA